MKRNAKKREAAIVGVGLLPWKSRYPDKTYAELALDAMKHALDDAGISRDDIDSVIYGLADVYVPVVRQACASAILQDHLGLEGKPSATVAGGATTGALAVRAAFAEVAAGLADIVLVVGTGKALDLYDPKSQKRSRAFLKTILLDLDTTWESPVDVLAAVNFAFCVQGHIERFGGPSEEQMAKVAVKNHRNALLNPLAQSGLDITVEDVLRSRRITGPIKFYDCCLYSEGAAAVIVASGDKAREISKRPVYITGIGAATKRSYMPDFSDLGRIRCQEIAARRAYEMAGIKDPLHELDLIELHDLLSGIEIMSYGEIGLCEIGQGGKLIDQGVVTRDGQLPVNPSGGMSGSGHSAGPSEIYRVGEVALQLREEAGKRQVAIRNGRGLVSTVGGPGVSQSCSIVLEVRDGR